MLVTKVPYASGQKNNRRPKAAVVYTKMRLLVENDALRQGTAVARFDVELYGLSFNERLSPITLNLRVVNKDVRLAIDSDESPTLFVVEPLDGSYSHCGPPCFFLAPIFTGSGGNHNGNLNQQAYRRTFNPPNVSKVFELSLIHI